MLKALVALCAAKAPSEAAARSIAAQCAGALLDSAAGLLETFALPPAGDGAEPPPLCHVERALHLVSLAGRVGGLSEWEWLGRLLGCLRAAGFF